MLNTKIEGQRMNRSGEWLSTLWWYSTLLTISVTLHHMVDK